MAVDTGSSNGPDVAQLLHRLRSALATLKGEVELAELDGHPFAAGVGETVEIAFQVLVDLEFCSTLPNRIHVVDDDSRIAAVTARRLSSLGWTTLPAASIPVDLPAGDQVLIDFGVLEAAGVEARTALSRNRFVVMSGSIDPGDQQQAAEWGASGYLIKPIDYVRLLGLLSRL